MPKEPRNNTSRRAAIRDGGSPLDNVKATQQTEAAATKRETEAKLLSELPRARANSVQQVIAPKFIEISWPAQKRSPTSPWWRTSLECCETIALHDPAVRRSHSAVHCCAENGGRHISPPVGFDEEPVPGLAMGNGIGQIAPLPRDRNALHRLSPGHLPRIRAHSTRCYTRAEVQGRGCSASHWAGLFGGTGRGCTTGRRRAGCPQSRARRSLHDGPSCGPAEYRGRHDGCCEERQLWMRAVHPLRCIERGCAPGDELHGHL